jgi:iron complex outermembrane receptor protein
MRKTLISRTISLSALHLLVAPGMAVWAVASAAQSAHPAVEEIIVTARKREESLQDTPVSITAFTADNLEARNIDNIGQIGDVTPNLTINTSASFSGSPSSTAIFLRGIGQVDFTLNTDPGVGLYVDGVYISRSIGGLIDLVDVERIEVLRGPQGTLFGRNTIGGAINVTSKLPSDEFGARLKATFGSDERADVLIEANVPISDNLLSRVSILSKNREGYVSRTETGDSLGDDDVLSGRATLSFIPSDTLTIQLALDMTREREESAPFVLEELLSTADFPAFHNAVIAQSLDPAVAGGRCFDPTYANPVCYNEASVLTGSSYKSKGTQESGSDVDVLGTSFTLSKDWDDTTFKSITAYREVESFSQRDGDHSPVLVNATSDEFDYEQISQEFQLLGTAVNNKLNWILGAYYFREKGDNANIVRFAPITILSGGHVENDSTALFAHASYDFTEKLSLTVGTRYTDDSREFTPEQEVLETPAGPAVPPVGTPLLPNVTAITEADDVNSMINLSYHWTEGLMTYATFSEGYKSGGFTQRVFPPIFPEPGQDPAKAIPSFDPEYVDQWELGWKSGWFDRRLQINGAVFFTDYTDLQINVQRGIAPTTENAAEAEIKGGELEIVALLIEGLLINISAGYTDALYKELDASVIGVTRRSELPGASKWTASASLSYEYHLSSGSSLTSRLDWSYRDSFFFDATNEVGQDDYETLNISLIWESENSDWRVSLFGNNVTDEEYKVAGASILQPGGFKETMYARPAEWGLSVQRRFGSY